LGADFKQGMVAVSGWSEETSLDLFEFLKGYITDHGVKMAICTDIDKDGMLEGPSTGIYTQIRDQQPDLLLIASGGISKMDDIEQLEQAGIEAVIVGKALYEKKITLERLEKMIIEKR
jgi:phosphoribosylformimino-5-aminoimidazole carboxamide ribotide isomerase